jgi:ribosomal-protein-alanine N-acetyltransferase
VTPIETARLTLAPMTRDIARAALRDRAALARLLGASVPDDWPGPDLAGWLPALARDLERDPALGEWVRLATQRAERRLVGDMGFHGPPNAVGTVEIGYIIVAGARRQGYATEGARALVDWAFARPDVRRVVARCAPDNTASIRVLERLGMERRPVLDAMLHWELRRPGE